MTDEFNLVDILVNQGFAIAVAVYLLYERTKFTSKLVETLERISTVLNERLPKM